MTDRARAVAGIVFLALLIGCARPSGSDGAGISFDEGGVHFIAPRGWQVQPSGADLPGGGRLLVRLAAQPLRDACAADGVATCPPPLDRLAAGGLLMAWYTTTCAGPACALPDGPLILVGDRQAVMTSAGTACGEIGQTESTAYVVSVSPQRLDSIVVCARSPGADTRQALASFLGAVDWRTP